MRNNIIIIIIGVLTILMGKAYRNPEDNYSKIQKMGAILGGIIIVLGGIIFILREL